MRLKYKYFGVGKLYFANIKIHPTLSSNIYEYLHHLIDNLLI